MESLSFTGYETHFPVLAGDLVLNQSGMLSLFLEEVLILLQMRGGFHAILVQGLLIACRDLINEAKHSAIHPFEEVYS
jgi:hypothetical protein